MAPPGTPGRKGDPEGGTDEAAMITEVDLPFRAARNVETIETTDRDRTRNRRRDRNVTDRTRDSISN
jgi:hypothetical protein